MYDIPNKLEEKYYLLLRNVTENITNTLKINESFETILNTLLYIFPANAGMILIKQNGYLKVITTKGFRNVKPGTLFHIKEVIHVKTNELTTNYIEDNDHNELFSIPFIKESKMKTSLYSPAYLNNEFIGLVLLSWQDIRKESREEKSLLKSAAQLISLGLLNSQMYEKSEELRKELENNISELSRKNRFQNALKRISEEIHKTIDLQEVLDKAVQIISDNVERADNACIYFVEGNEAVMKCYEGYPSWFIEKVSRIPYPKGFTWKTIIKGEPQYVDYVSQNDPIGPAGKEVGTNSYVSLPLIYENECIGVININSYSKDAFSEDEINFLESLKYQIETAINNARKVEALKSSEHRFSAFMNHLPGAAVIKETNGKYLYINRAYEDLLEKKTQEVIGKTVFDFFDQDFANQLNEADLQVIRENKAVQTMGQTFIGNKLRYWLVKKFPIKVDNKKFLLGTIAVDITELNEKQQKIKDQAELLNIASDAIMVVNLDDELIYWNKGAENLYKWTSEEVVGRKPQEFFIKDINEYIEALDKIKKHGELKEKFKHVTKDNEEIIVQSRWTLVYDDISNAKAIFIVNTDITEKEKIEKQLFQAQRLESIGTLAGGIAHDFNNMLQPITMSLDYIKQNIEDKSLQNWLDILEEGTYKAADLVNQILTFSRDIEGHYTEINIKSFVKEVVKILQQTFPKSIEIESDISEESGYIEGDITKLHQVLMNLCVNSRDAMPNGGKVTISVNEIYVDENLSRKNIDASVGSYVLISVSDTGTGIAPENLDKIFDPFFTTKEPGKGTGLGLSTVFSIVKDHNGFVDVKSEVSKGTEFKIYLPLLSNQGLDNRVSEDYQENAKGKQELILIIDDEAPIRQITKITLENNGYRVLTASNGEQGLEIYEDNNEIELVIVDMRMPVMGGADTIKNLKSMDDQVKIIAIAGFKEDIVNYLTESKNNVSKILYKPYTSQKLLKSIHEALDQK